MGLFGIFKKRVSVEATLNTSENYSPWKSEEKTRNDDYAIAAFIHYCEFGGKPIGKSNDDYPRYFSYTYNVSDPKKYHKKVIADGYLTEAPARSSLERLKVDQLKEILTNAGLPVKGKKDDLVSRIVEEVPLETLKLEPYYIPSEKGLEHLKQYGYVFELKEYGISLEEYADFKKNRPAYLKPNDVMWQLLGARTNEKVMLGHYASVRFDFYNMGKLLEKESKFVDALYYYIVSLYYETSGVDAPGAVYNSDGTIRPPRFVDTSAELTINSASIEALQRLKEHFNGSIIERCFRSHGIPKHCIKKKNFEKLIADILDCKPIDIYNYTK